MSTERELLRLEIDGILEFRIHGFPPRPRDDFPTEARTSYTLATPLVGSLSINGSPSSASNLVRSEPFLFEEQAYQFELGLLNPSDEPVELLLRGIDLLKGKRKIGKAAFAAVVNFRSAVGYTDLECKIGGRITFSLRLEVFPSKLDYRRDLLELRADLQAEVRGLVHALHGKTVRKLRRKRGRPQDVEWLASLEECFDRLTHAFEAIIRSPRSTVTTETRFENRQKPVRTSSTATHWLRTHGHLCKPVVAGQFKSQGKEWVSRHLPVVEKRLTFDTPENRFLIFALGVIHRRVRRLRAEIRGVETKSRHGAWMGFLDRTAATCQRFLSNPSLAEVSRSMSMATPTLALHLTTGYRELFVCWIELCSILEIHGGPVELPEKDLSKLYELWCFVALANILRNELGLKAKSPSWLRVERNRVVLDLAKGRYSVLSLHEAGKPSVEVSYNREDRTPTGTARPDNTLEIIKADGQRRFRYLFDAKYRYSDDPDYVKRHKAPGPPEDSVYRMHAYRDQVVAGSTSKEVHALSPTIWDVGTRIWVQQSVAAFVLYPNSRADAVENRFFTSIDAVGVGALPFLPSRREEVTNLIRRIHRATEATIDDGAIELSTTEERKRIAMAHEYGLVAIVQSEEQLRYILKEGIYHMPLRQDKDLRLRADFIILLLSKSRFGSASGAAYVARIRAVKFGSRNQIQPPPPSSGSNGPRADIYAWFKLGDLTPVERRLPYTGSPPFFGVTTRLAVVEAFDVADLLLVREPEQRLKRELQNAGLEVRVYDATATHASPYDIESLRVRFVVGSQGNSIDIRFDPVASTFTWPNGKIAWRAFMFEPDKLIEPVRKLILSPPE